MSKSIGYTTDSSTLADLLERILDKGIVVVGDIKIDLAQVELLNIHIRLVICSVDKAKEIGLDWWNNKKDWNEPLSAPSLSLQNTLDKLEKRLMYLESLMLNSATQKGKIRRKISNE